MKQNKKKKPKCRCYINAKYYARAARDGKGTMKNYIPCPIHEVEEPKEPDSQESETK